MELEEVYYEDGKKQSRKFTHAKDEGVRPGSTGSDTDVTRPAAPSRGNAQALPVSVRRCNDQLVACLSRGDVPRSTLHRRRSSR